MLSVIHVVVQCINSQLLCLADFSGLLVLAGFFMKKKKKSAAALGACQLSITGVLQGKQLWTTLLVALLVDPKYGDDTRYSVKHPNQLNQSQFSDSPSCIQY